MGRLFTYDFEVTAQDGLLRNHKAMQNMFVRATDKFSSTPIVGDMFTQSSGGSSGSGSQALRPPKTLFSQEKSGFQSQRDMVKQGNLFTSSQVRQLRFCKPHIETLCLFVQGKPMKQEPHQPTPSQSSQSSTQVRFRPIIQLCTWMGEYKTFILRKKNQ